MFNFSDLGDLGWTSAGTPLQHGPGPNAICGRPKQPPEEMMPSSSIGEDLEDSIDDVAEGEKMKATSARRAKKRRRG